MVNQVQFPFEKLESNKPKAGVIAFIVTILLLTATQSYYEWNKRKNEMSKAN